MPPVTRSKAKRLTQMSTRKVGRPKKNYTPFDLEQRKQMNNEASKKFRQKKRLAYAELQRELSSLQETNKELEFKLLRLSKCIALFQQVSKCQYCDQDPQAQFLSLFRLKRVTKDLNSQKQIWRPWSSNPSSSAIVSQ